MRYLKLFTGASAVLWVGACTPVEQFTGQTFALGTPQQNPNSNPVSANSPATTAGLGAESGLVNILVGQLGITPQQALGGVGSIFSVARQRMNPGDFSQLSHSIPGMDRYLTSVPQRLASADASALFGLMDGQASGVVALADSFQSLGMNASMISRFVPVMLQYVQNQSGAGAMSLLESALYY